MSLLPHDGFFALIASFVQTQTTDPITEQQRVKVFKYTFMATAAKKDADVAAEANLMNGAPARTSSQSSGVES